MRMYITAAAQAQGLLSSSGPVGPTAIADTATSISGQTIQIFVLANDTHPDDGEILTLTSVSVDEAKGSATISSAGVIEFTGNYGTEGDVVISYTIRDEDNNESSSTVTVTVTLNNPPIANPGTSSMVEDGSAITIDVLLNDTHVDNDTLSVVSATVNSSEGSVSIVSNKVVFEPATNFYGAATITYTIEDENGDRDTSTHVVNVSAVADNPVAFDDTGATASETLIVIDVLANDTHPDGDTLTLVSVTLDTPADGTVTIVSQKVNFTPAAGVSGDVSMTYVIEDEHSNQDTGAVTISVALPAGSDPFDDPATTAIALMVNGSTSGVGKTNCNLWSNKVGIDGVEDACEWRTNSGTREEVDLRIADDFTTDDYWVRCRFKVTDAGTTKTYVQFNNEYMDDYNAWFDITDDATADASRVMQTSSSISDATCAKNANGFMYVKFRLNFSTESDANGTNTLNMSDAWNGDGEMDVSSLTVVAIQDYTFELIT